MHKRISALSRELLTMEQGNIYEFISKGCLYHYQTEGTGTATVEVSNNLKKPWTILADFTDTDSAIVAHAWKYQRVTLDGLTITVLQGSI